MAQPGRLRYESGWCPRCNGRGRVTEFNIEAGMQTSAKCFICHGTGIVFLPDPTPGDTSAHWDSS